jgi:predicted DCC family thiol-disulfide oxidoreductase YuxK
MPSRFTTPPGKYVVLYDGLCKFCRAGSEKLLGLARYGAIERVDFQQPGALDRFPGLTHADCMRAMQLVTPAGRIYTGFEAAVQAVVTRRVIGWLAYVYYVPGLRQLLDGLYALIARNRYRIMGKLDPCEGGTCSLHGSMR